MSMINTQHIYRPHDRKLAGGRADRADATTTQVVRNALNSAANQMKRVLIRTSFSPIIYEAYDFAVGLYDSEIRLLSQAPTLPAFMGTLSFCIEGAVAGIGGADKLEPGDILLYNVPFGTGSHAQDMAVIVPVFYAGELVGYAVSKGHLTDIGAKEPYCSDSIDMFQEGLILDGVRIYRRGELVEDIMKILLANTRAPSAVRGDVLAEVGCCRDGADELVRVIERFGLETFKDCVERMQDHGEAVVRDFISRIPDGRYHGVGHLDNDGITDDPIQFSVEVIVEGSEVTFDISGVPDARKGPLNTPLPSTISTCRIVLAMLSGNESPTEGHFRPMRVISRPGSMYHPVAPQPTYMYGFALTQLFEALFQAFAAAIPGGVPSGSAADICGAMFYIFDEERRETLVSANPLPVGLGALPDADGSIMLHPAIGQSSLPSAELLETKFTFVQYENWEITPDTAGPGKFRGGPGWKVDYRMLSDVSFMTAIERTKVPGWAQDGGRSGAANKLVLHYPDGRSIPTLKVTGVNLPKDTLVEVWCGGGGGFGDPSQREKEAVLGDVRLGYLTEDGARRDYPHAFA